MMSLQFPLLKNEPMDRQQNRSSPLRNLRRESIYKPHAQAVFIPHFDSNASFETFYNALTDADKDVFLGIASKYVFLVKCGDWHVDIPECNPVIDYFTNSFKMVSLFSLIESLSSEKHEDFYDWLRKQGGDAFPIQDKSKLSSLYEQYKKTYGSIRRCVNFFERLSPALQLELKSGFKANGVAATEIKDVAKFLYNLRSKFVHEGEFVLEIANIPVISKNKDTTTITDISIPTLLRIFEKGVLAYFGRSD
jgi:hypothetical protein